MKRNLWTTLGSCVASTAMVLLLTSCSNGKDGAQGPAGTNGTNGSNGSNGTNGTNGVVVLKAGSLSPEQWAALNTTISVTDVKIPNGKPVVTFSVKDSNGSGITGLGWTAQSATAYAPSLPNFAFGIAKFVPEDATTKAPSKWVNYCATTVAAAPAATRPSTDNQGTLVDNGDGTYAYTFWRDISAAKAIVDGFTDTATSKKADLGPLAYEPTAVHRVSVVFSGAARGTGNNTPDASYAGTAVNLATPNIQIYDFVPSTGAKVTTPVRDVVNTAKCNECHQGYIVHGGQRSKVEYCVICHTDQRKFGYSEATIASGTFTSSTRKVNGMAVGDLPFMVHALHMGKELTKQGYGYPSVGNIAFNKVGYSILDNGQKLCLKCHSTAAQSENYATKPSRLACGSCHDGVDWTTHAPSFDLSDDHACSGCHQPQDVPLHHQGTNLTKHNPTVAAELANFTYEVASATVDSSNNLLVKFRIKNNGTAITFLDAAAGLTNPLTGFTGAPTFLLGWAMPEGNGLAYPSDFNNLKADYTLAASNYQPPTVGIAALLNSTTNASTGSLSVRDSDGYYTATILSAKAFPIGAKMRTVSLQGYFTQVTPAVARHAIATTKNVTGDSARRMAVDSAKCFNCHEWFEGHGGNRVYDVQTCVICHNPGLVTSGRGMSDASLSTYYNAGLFTADQKLSLKTWTGLDFVAGNPVTAGATNVALTFPQVSNNMKDMIHGIHAGKDRTYPFRIVRDRTPSAVNVIDGAGIGYPGVLQNCNGCHFYDPSDSTNRHYTQNVPASLNLLGSREMANNVDPATITTPAVAKASLGTANPFDVLTTPFTASCVSCHNSDPAQAHMKLNGGQISVYRSALNVKGESCAVCHGAGSELDPVKVHK